MRIIVVGDIHGNNHAFRKALKSISLKKEDKLILLGDLIDRGRDSKEVLDTILLLKSVGFNNIICLRGNHEQLFLDSYSDESKEYIWLKNGGDRTLRSFKVNYANQIPQKYVDLIDSFLFYYEYDIYIFVHAGLNFMSDDPFLDKNSLLWKRDMNVTDLLNSPFSDKIVIHGHTPLDTNEIKRQFEFEHIKCLDNGIYMEEIGYGGLVLADLTNKKLKFIHKNEGN